MAIACLSSALPADAAKASAVHLKGRISNTQYESIGRLASNSDQHIVRDLNGNMFVSGINGTLLPLPLGTDVGSLMTGAAGSKYAPEIRGRMWNTRGPKLDMGPVTLTYVADDGSVPVEISSRQYLTNGMPTVGGGSMIREYPQNRTTHSYARVYHK